MVVYFDSREHPPRVSCYLKFEVMTDRFTIIELVSGAVSLVAKKDKDEQISRM